MDGTVLIRDLADALHPRSAHCKALALLKAYFDETGTHDGSPITAIGGYVGSAKQWEQVEGEWREVLALYADKGVKTFYATDAIAQKGEFERISKPFLNHILTQLSQTLGRSGVEPFFSAVVKRDWDAMPDDVAFSARYPHPIDLCFENLVEHLSKWSRTYGGGEKIIPMFAYSTEFSPRMAEIGRVYGSQDWYREILGPIAFGFPSEVIPLQAADLIAHQSNWKIEKRAYRPQESARTSGTKMRYWATGCRPPVIPSRSDT